METAHTIKEMAKRYRHLAKEQDILDLEWYAGQLVKVMDELEQNDWSGNDIKQQVLGRLSSIMP